MPNDPRHSRYVAVEGHTGTLVISLEQDQLETMTSRDQVISALKDDYKHPGATAQEIADKTDFALSTVRSRLRELEKEGKVRATKRSGREHFGWQNTTTVTRKYYRLARS